MRSLRNGTFYCRLFSGPQPGQLTSIFETHFSVSLTGANGEASNPVRYVCISSQHSRPPANWTKRECRFSRIKVELSHEILKKKKKEFILKSEQVLLDTCSNVAFLSAVSTSLITLPGMFCQLHDELSSQRASTCLCVYNKHSWCLKKCISETLMTSVGPLAA